MGNLENELPLQQTTKLQFFWNEINCALKILLFIYRSNWTNWLWCHYRIFWPSYGTHAPVRFFFFLLCFCFYFFPISLQLTKNVYFIVVSSEWQQRPLFWYHFDPSLIPFAYYQFLLSAFSSDLCNSSNWKNLIFLFQNSFNCYGILIW